MGDHYDYVDPGHGSDETPIHAVTVSAFYIGKNDITVQAYCDYLNSALSQNLINVTGGTIAPPTPTYVTPNPTLWPRTVSGTIAPPTPTYRTPNPTLFPR